MVRGPVSMAIVGLISLMMFGLVFGGPRVLDRVLPESALAWIEENDSLGLFGDGTDMVSFTTEASNGDDPASHLHDGKDGWRASDKVAAMPGNSAVFLRDVMSGRRKSRGASPAAVEVIRPMTGCSFTPPTAGAFVGHVSAWGSNNMALGLSTYGDAELAAAVRGFGKVYRETGLRQVPGLSGLTFDAFDVAVTETGKPVYLVLQGRGGNRLWALHLAPGAQLERVVLLGGNQAGVAHLPDGVPVEVMREDEMAACGLPGPAYPLNPGALLFQSLEAGVLDQEEASATLAMIDAKVQDYDRWFRSAFGVSALETMAGNWDGGSVAVAGPLPATPEARAVWHPLTQAQAWITADTYVEYDALTEQGVDFRARVLAIAESFAWGDLKNLRQGVEF